MNLAKKAAVEETLAEEPPAGEKETAEGGGEPGGQPVNTAPKKAVSQEALLQMLAKLKKGDILTLADLFIKEGETSPPKRYTSGSMILAMENAGQLIEDEELRAQIKGSGIGTSATRAEILKSCSTSTTWP